MIIIGLGNPGEQFKNTRHNAGFMAVDSFAKENNFGEFSLEKNLEAEVLKSGKIVLAKPQTFMNESGKAVKKITLYYKTPFTNSRELVNGKKSKNIELVVIHDDIDLPFGKIKFSKGSGSGGHKGVESIFKSIKTKDFIRLRIGINTTKKKTKAQNVVLKKLSTDEEKLMKKTLKTISESLSYLIENGIEKTMNKYNQ